MTKLEHLALLRLLSALESWVMSQQTNLPDYLGEQLGDLMERLQEEILK